MQHYASVKLLSHHPAQVANDAALVVLVDERNLEAEVGAVVQKIQRSHASASGLGLLKSDSGISIVCLNLRLGWRRENKIGGGKDEL